MVPAPAAVCNTAACLMAANAILGNLSPSYKKLDPCANFQEYVCGNYTLSHPLGPEASSQTVFNDVSDRNMAILRKILDGSYPGESAHSSFSPRNLARALAFSDQQNFDKMKLSYETCLNLDAIKKAGKAPLVDVLVEITKQFPIDEADYGKSTLLTKADWPALQRTVLWFEQTLGRDTLISVGPTQDDKKPDEWIVYVGPVDRMGLPSLDYYEMNTTVVPYIDVVAQELSLLHPSAGGKANAKSIAPEIVAFEKAVVAIAPDRDTGSDVTKYYNIMSLNDTVKLVPELDLGTMLTTLVPSNYTMDRLLTSFPEIIAKLSPILANTTKQAMQSFFISRAIQVLASAVEADEVKPWKQFSNKLNGRDPNAVSARWRTCISHVDGNLGGILGRFYVEQAFSARDKELGDQIVSDIKKQFIAKLDTLAWVEDSVKVLAKQKVNNIVQKIGYPTASPNIMSPDSLGEYYQDYNVTASYFTNIANALTRGVNRTWSNLGKPVDKGRWGMTVPTVNAYYSPSNNEIVFPAGIMQFPFFNGDLPNYVNYGAFGSVSGHELTHAFDDSGRHFDMNGYYNDWWTNATIAEFEKRAQCFVDEFSQYTIKGPNNETVHINGKLTLGENIADSGGLSGSYASWKNRTKTTPDPGLPGLSEFTNDQLFYISFASVWCGVQRPQTVMQQVLTDPHSPAGIRILGTVSNSRGFKDAFNCPKEPVCELW